MKQVITDTVLTLLRRIRRLIYRLRLYVPGLREKHMLEEMVGPLGCWETLQLYQANVLLQNGLKPHHTLLDIGCGPLQGGIAFIKYLDKGNYVGLDINPTKINASYKLISKYELANKNPHLFVANIFDDEIRFLLKFDFVWASQILYYFDETKLNALFKMLKQLMNPHGKFLADIIGGKHHGHHLEVKHEIHSLDVIIRYASQNGLKVKNLGELTTFGYPKRMIQGTNVLLEVTFK